MGWGGGTDCYQAAVGLCWPALCYLLQRWLGSRRGVWKVGQHIIYLPPLLLPSVTISRSSTCSPFTNTDSFWRLFHYISRILSLCFTFSTFSHAYPLGLLFLSSNFIRFRDTKLIIFISFNPPFPGCNSAVSPCSTNDKVRKREWGKGLEVSSKQQE